MKLSCFFLCVTLCQIVAGSRTPGKTEEESHVFEDHFAPAILRKPDLKGLLEKTAPGAMLLFKSIAEIAATSMQKLIVKNLGDVSVRAADFQQAVQALGDATASDISGRQAAIDKVVVDMNGLKSILSAIGNEPGDEQLFEELSARLGDFDMQMTELKKGLYAPDIKFEAFKAGKRKIDDRIAVFQKGIDRQAYFSAALGFAALYSAVSEAGSALTEMQKQSAHEPFVVQKMESWNTDLETFNVRIAERFKQEDWNEVSLRRASKAGKLLLSRLEAFISEEASVKMTSAKRQKEALWGMATNALSCASSAFQVSSWGAAGHVVPIMQKAAVGFFAVAGVTNGATTYMAHRTGSKAEYHLNAMNLASSELDRATAQLEELKPEQQDDVLDF